MLRHGSLKNYSKIARWQMFDITVALFGNLILNKQTGESNITVVESLNTF